MAIVDPKTLVEIYPGLIETGNNYSEPKDAYVAWANKYGLSPTATLPGLVLTDDSSTELDLGFVVTSGGSNTKIMQNTEGGIGIMTAIPDGGISNTNRQILAAIPEQKNVTRNYQTKGNVNASYFISCKDPAADCKSLNGLWQKGTDVAILYMEYQALNDANNKTNVAYLFRPGSLELVVSRGATANPMVQFFLLDSTTASTQALVGEGSIGKVLELGQVYSFATVPPKFIRGRVLGADGQPTITTVRAYDRANGAISGEATTDANGDYEIQTTPDEHYVVCLDESGSLLNALIQDRVIPVD